MTNKTMKTASAKTTAPTAQSYFSRKIGNTTYVIMADWFYTPAPTVMRFAIDSVLYYVNDERRTMEVAPYIADGRTMVPLRIIVEALGSTDLEFESGSITFSLDGQTIAMTISQPLPDNMGTPAIVAGRTFVPLRFIIEQIGATVRWDGNARAAYIYID